MPRTSLCLLSCLLIASGPGCSSSKPKEAIRAQVSGTITLDKAPLKTGNITFDPGNGTPGASFDILDGKYEGRAPLGNCTVRINSFIKVSMKEKMKFDGPGYDKETEQNVLPPRYNSKSEVKREIVGDGTNVFNFDLQKD